ncbi:MAG: hypothetical protein DMG09_04165, partial [Acidobacteria bacterium]
SSGNAGIARHRSNRTTHGLLTTSPSRSQFNNSSRLRVLAVKAAYAGFTAKTRRRKESQRTEVFISQDLM